MSREGSLNFLGYRALGDSDECQGPSLQKILVDICVHFHRFQRFQTF